MFRRFIVCVIIALSWWSSGCARADADAVQCLVPGPWHTNLDFSEDFLMLQIDGDCFDIETDGDLYEA